MIEITLFTKTLVKGEIKYEEKNTIKIKKPETFKEFEEEIRSKFDLADKEIAIKIINADKDEINIKDEESYTDEDNRVLKYIVYEIIETQKDENLDELNLDELLNIENELLAEEKEFEKLINKKFEIEMNKEENNEINFNDIFDEINEKEDKNELLLTNFVQDFTKKISSTTENKKKTFDSIKNEYILLEKKLDDKINSLNLDVNNNVSESNDTKKKMSQMNQHLPFIIENNKKLPIMFSIEADKKDYEIFEDEANSFTIKDITIKNITQSKVSFKNKYWIKDNKSDENIEICTDKNAIKINGNLGISEEKKTSIDLYIKNPTINKNYFFKFYIGDNTNNSTIYENVTDKPIFINITIKEKEDEINIDMNKNDEINNNQNPKEDNNFEEENHKKDENLENNIKDELEKKEEEIKVGNDENKENQILINNSIEPKQPDNINVDKPEQPDNPEPKQPVNPEPINPVNPEPNIPRGNLSEEEIQAIYDEFDESYYLSSFMDEDEFKQIIVANNGDRKILTKIIEDKM